MRISQIKFGSWSEGPTKNTTIWVAGCSIQCPGCFNPHLWSRTSGIEVPLHKILKTVECGNQKGDQGVAIVGGEPFDQVDELHDLVLQIKQIFPGKKVTVYTGYRIEQLLKANNQRPALFYIDFLVDGPFIIKKALQSGYRGSSNQRVIDVQNSILLGFPKILDWDNLVIITKSEIITPAFITLKGGEYADQCGFDDQLDTGSRDNQCQDDAIHR